MKRKFILVSTFFAIFFLGGAAYAQKPPIDLSAVYEINDKDAVNDDILAYGEKGIKRADVAFSNQIFGVLQDKPILVYRSADKKGKPVVRSGIAEVNVTTFGGTFKPGDYITSSQVAGKGQKANQSGYVLGIAIGSFRKEKSITVEGKQVELGKITVAVRIEYAELTNTRSVVRLLDYFNIAAFQTAQNPERASQFIKYFSASLIVLASLIFSFLLFARSITKSIEAIGRNPLAKSAIQLSILINAGLTIGTIVVGIAAAFIILQL